MKNVAIILAGGVGSRVGKKTPKQFLKIKGREMILYSLETFSKCSKIDKIVIVSYANCIKRTISLVKKNGIEKVVSVVKGGATRQESVLNGLEEVNRLFKNCNVLIHDSARPMVSEKIIIENIKALTKCDCTTTALPVSDSVYKVKDGSVIEGLDRETIYLAQTPQCGKLDLLYKSYKNAKNTYTDEANLLASLGYKTRIILGDVDNKKVTFKEDLDNF